MKRSRPVLTLSIVGVLAWTCGGDPGPGEDAPRAQAEAPGGSAAVRGVATYRNGDPDRPIDMAGVDPLCASLHDEPVETERLVTGGDGRLANVFVYVAEGLDGRYDPPDTLHLLNQVGCRYAPRVSGMMVGQPLVVRNSDPTLHNVHATPQRNPELNRGQPMQGMELRESFEKAEVMIPFRCDVHPWMRSWLAVLPHPFFAVTDEEGTFSIEGLPAGDYVLEAWHEVLGRRRLEVTLGDGQTAEVRLDWADGGSAARRSPATTRTAACRPSGPSRPVAVRAPYLSSSPNRRSRNLRSASTSTRFSASR